MFFYSIGLWVCLCGSVLPWQYYGYHGNSKTSLQYHRNIPQHSGVGYSICLMDSVLFVRVIRFVIDINTPQWCDVKLVI